MMKTRSDSPTAQAAGPAVHPFAASIVPTPVTERPRTRSPRQLQAVLQELDSNDGFRSAQDIYTCLRLGGQSVGLSTVYRSLRALTEAGEADCFRDGGGEQLFRRCRTRRHHHYVVCRSCRLGVEVTSPLLERLATELIEAQGFIVEGHRIELFGSCPTCAWPDQEDGSAESYHSSSKPAAVIQHANIK